MDADEYEDQILTEDSFPYLLRGEMDDEFDSEAQELSDCMVDEVWADE